MMWNCFPPPALHAAASSAAFRSVEQVPVWKVWNGFSPSLSCSMTSISPPPGQGPFWGSIHIAEGPGEALYESLARNSKRPNFCLKPTGGPAGSLPELAETSAPETNGHFTRLGWFHSVRVQSYWPLYCHLSAFL